MIFLIYFKTLERDKLIKKTLEEFFNNLLEQNLNIYDVGEISYENIIELMNLVVDNLNHLNREINNRRDTVNENIRSRINEYENEQAEDIENELNNEIQLFAQSVKKEEEEKEKENFKVGVELKKQDYIDQLNKFLLENQPAIEGVQQKKSEDRERILLDIENPHIKIEDDIDQQDTQNNQVVDEKLRAISYITSETTPKAPEFSRENITAPAVKNENVDGINSNSNLISDSDDVIIIDDDDDDEVIIIDDDDNDGTQGGIIHISPVDDEELIDIDQKDGEKIKIEVKKESELDDDGDIDFSIKCEETEEGFIRDIPNRDNLGEQIFIDLTQDDSDDDDEVKLKDDPEMNTDFQRLVPASQALNILREQEQNETKLEKVNDQGNTLAAVKYKPKRKQKNDLEVIEFKPKKTKKISRHYL